LRVHREQSRDALLGDQAADDDVAMLVVVALKGIGLFAVGDGGNSRES
jgi:hypothetical protein